MESESLGMELDDGDNVGMTHADWIHDGPELADWLVIETGDCVIELAVGNMDCMTYGGDWMHN